MTRLEPVLRFLLGGVFAAAGALKIWDPLAFAHATARLQILPGSWIGSVSILLPWVEVVSGFALIAWPKGRDAALRLLLALLAVFTPVLIVAILRGASSCGCFGAEGSWLGNLTVGVARNLLLTAIAGVLLRRERQALCATPAG